MAEVCGNWRFIAISHYIRKKSRSRICVPEEKNCSGWRELELALEQLGEYGNLTEPE